MRRMLVLLICLHAAAACLAQTWEAGGAAGAGFAPGLAASNAAGHATTGLANGPAFGAYVGQNMYKRLGGEIRYTFRSGGLHLSAGGTKVAFGGQSHLIEYDVLFYGAPPGSERRPFLVVGAGARITRGTGPEVLYQPLWEYALLTKTRQAQPVVCLGGGFKWKLSERLLLRAEVRDYLSPSPRQVIEPVGETKIRGWLNDIVPLAGISYAFR